MPDTLQGPALAEALARLIGVDVGRVRMDGCVAAHDIADGSDVTLMRRMDGVYILTLWRDTRPEPAARGTGPTPEAARDDALARLRAGYEAVRDVLDPWREGPPGEDGWYEMLTTGGRYDVVQWTGSGLWPIGEPTVAPRDWRPARYRALHLSATAPERSKG